MTTRGVIAARVIDVRDHPHAERIWIADLDAGGIKASVVFGGTGPVEADDIVAYAPPRAVLAGYRNPQRMRSRRFRGVRSEGMLCSAEELGWAYGGPDEVLILARHLLPGTGLDDASPQDVVADPPAMAPFLAAARDLERCATGHRTTAERSVPVPA